nr:hypothetical protein [uncultured Chitinophaga sp.]
MADLFYNSPGYEDGSPLLFRDFVFKSRFYRLLIGLSVISMVVQLAIFKYYYPNAAFINGDSYKYIGSAFYNLDIDIYPVGYSKFLRIFSTFSRSDVSLVVFQYFSLQISTFWLLLTLFYFFNIKRGIQIILFVCVTISPVMLYLANYVSSDSIFIALSICWFTTLVWVMFDPNWKLVCLHSVIVLLAFMVRYNALYYPVISSIAFFLNKGHLRLKFIGVILMFLGVGIFINDTALHYKKLTGLYQFSPFSGWQMANNAIYAYQYVDSSRRKNLPEKFSGIDYMVRHYLDTTRVSTLRYPEEMLDVSAVYMWLPYSPLRIYMHKLFEKDTTASDLKKWAQVAPLYKEYGAAIIKAYPIDFVKMYLWPNFLKYYAPPVEFLANYGFRADTISPIARAWFGYDKDKRKLTTRFKSNSVSTLDYYPIICAVMNAVYIMMSISFLILKGRQKNPRLFQLWILFTCFWIFNLCFSVFASPVALRFQIFPLLLCLSSNFLLLDYVLLQGREKEGPLPSVSY